MTSLTKNIKIVDLQRHIAKYESEFRAAMSAVLGSTNFIRGAELSQFESSLSAYLGGANVVGCASGTDALCLALRALDLQPGDEVITTAFTFCATTEAIVACGLKPVFADIDPQTFCIDPAQVERLITDRTRVLLPVHLYGHPADMQRLADLARQHHLAIVEDAAQSMGGEALVDGQTRKLGTIGTLGCTSFFPTKNLACFGDGGAVMTSDSLLAERTRMIANHGSKKKYHNEIIGINSRLDTLQAAVLNVNLAHLDEMDAERRTAAMRYTDQLRSLKGITAPEVVDGHVFHCYVVRVEGGRRDELKDYLASRGIQSMVHYPAAIHQLPAYSHFATQALPEAERAAREVLSLPMFPGITTDEIDLVVNTIREWTR